MPLVAIEDKESLARAIFEWRTRFGRNSEDIRAMGGNLYWHEEFGIWGCFYPKTIGKNMKRYWIAFGKLPFNFRRHIICEINPPEVGVNARIQGVIARDSLGKRWIMHRGSLNSRITKAGALTKIDAVSRESVKFSDRSEEVCCKVANLDGTVEDLQRGIADFVDLCHRVRLGVTNGLKFKKEEEQIGVAEKPGSYVRGAQASALVDRKHAIIWQALLNELNLRKVQNTNARVGRYGPDLRTIGKQPILFEIKSDESVSELQRAVGQLLIYEKLLGLSHKKVLVVPRKANLDYINAIEQMNIEFLTYTREDAQITFDQPQLDKILTP